MDVLRIRLSILLKAAKEMNNIYKDDKRRSNLEKNFLPKINAITEKRN